MGRLACTLFLLIACITVEPSSSTVLFVKHVDGAVDRLLAELESRSDPGSTDYLSWLTRSQVREILEPRPEHIETIKSLTNHHGAVIHSIVGDKVVMSAASAAFVDAVTASGAVDFVSASGAPSVFSTLLPKTRPNRQRASANQTKDTVNAGPQACLASLAGVTPTCIRAAYGLAESSATNAAAHGQAFIVNQGFMSTDISAFQTKYKLPLQPVAHTVGLNDGKAGDEATLDAQYIMSTGQGVPTTYVYLDGSMTNPFTNWLVWAANASDATIPKVHSLSLGAAESEVGTAIIGRMNTEMAALGTRGVTILFASGDSGWQPSQKFGAASPYVTAVGGVYNGELRNRKLQGDSLSTGGFASSALNKAGTWQKAAIASYMNTTGKRPARIDPSQRAVPDLSAYDDEIEIVLNGAESSLSGTSAACPMVAGMLAKINDALAAAGHSTLGFANPFLYAHEAAFLDITLGNNRGIAAVVGYDPLTGLGTFSPTTFNTLKAAALAAAEKAAARRTAAMQ